MNTNAIALTLDPREVKPDCQGPPAGSWKTAVALPPSLAVDECLDDAHPAPPALRTLDGALAGALVGGLIGLVGGPVGAAVGMPAGALAGWVITGFVLRRW